MNYFVREVIDGDPTAGPKARNDFSAILEDAGWKPLTLGFQFEERISVLNKRSALLKIRDNLYLRNEWHKALKKVRRGDTVLIQFPVLRRPIALATAVKAVRRRGGKVICIVHDLELLRYTQRNDVGLLKKLRISMQERSVLNCMDGIIAHNTSMMNSLKGMGFVNCKMIPLEIFDYLIPDFTIKQRQLSNVVTIAGTLRPQKCKYLLHLPDDIQFNLYGIGYKDQGMHNVKYYGAFPPDELPNNLEASFGLVWDGDSADSCTGVSGEYLRINNPHKVSLYLASGLPVIIWKEAAMAEFVMSNNCGFAVNSLDEIGQRITELTDNEYKDMLNNTRRISKQLRAGDYTKKAVLTIAR